MKSKIQTLQSKCKKCGKKMNIPKRYANYCYDCSEVELFKKEILRGCGKEIDWEVEGNTPIAEYICERNNLCPICLAKLEGLNNILKLIKK